ncbi:hypothetical protein QBC39DRAFT_341479 [Podospora conica]|nr:hypothetical protein QBC39DRAFT_341479 [Schizothecium conicum]
MASLCEEDIAQEQSVAQEKAVAQEVAAQEEIAAQDEVVIQEDVIQAMEETTIDDTPKHLPAKATTGNSLVDKVLWRGTLLKDLTFESSVKQEQLVNTIRQLEKIEAVKPRFIYVSTFLVNMETLARPWHPKYHRPQEGGEKTAYEPAYRTSIEALAIAHHLFCARTNEDTCQACQAPNSEGPSAQCVVPDLADGKGECTNCQYRGRGNQCSLRVEREKKIKAEQAKLSPRKSPRKSPTKAQAAAAARAAADVASNEKAIDITADDLLLVKDMLDEKKRAMLWKIAHPGKRLPKNL